MCNNQKITQSRFFTKRSTSQKKRKRRRKKKKKLRNWEMPRWQTGRSFLRNRSRAWFTVLPVRTSFSLVTVLTSIRFTVCHNAGKIQSQSGVRVGHHSQWLQVQAPQWTYRWRKAGGLITFNHRSMSAFSLQACPGPSLAILRPP